MADMTRKFFTLKQAAEQIGCHPSTVTRQAERLGVGMKIGRDVLVTPGEIKRLKAAITPRPRPKR